MAFSCRWVSEQTRLTVIISGTTESNESQKEITGKSEIRLGKALSKSGERHEKGGVIKTNFKGT